MSHKPTSDASDLRDGQWARSEPLIPAYAWGRGRELGMRSVVNGMFYISKTGCQWDMVPKEYPNYNRVYHPFRRWSREGAWEEINAALREQVREEDGRQAQPSAASLDSQSVKTTEVGGRRAGLTAARRSRGANAIYWLIRWAMS